MHAAPEDPLRLSSLLRAPSGQVLEAVRKRGLEGVVGKRISSTYEPGERSGAWIKHRVNREQEFVIGGYIPGSHGFDALLLGVYQNKQLIFSAKVKNGFVPRTRDEIFPALKTLQTAKCPFTNLPETRASAVGRIVNRRENGAMPLGQTEIGLPGRFRRMDGCRTPAAISIASKAKGKGYPHQTSSPLPVVLAT
jgi:hypothetical protein